MDRQLRQSWPARIAAAGFIIVIVAGNLWLGFALMATPIPVWVGAFFASGIFVSLGGGLGMLVFVVHRHVKGGAPPSDDEADGDHQAEAP